MELLRLRGLGLIAGAVVLTAVGNAVFYYSGFGGPYADLIGWLTLIPYVLGFSLLFYAFFELNYSSAYALWAAGTILLTIVSGQLFFLERLSILQIGSLGLLILGLLGIGFTNQKK